MRQRLPIQKSLLMVLLDHVTLMYADQPYLSVLYQTLFSTAYFGLFRVGELTTSEHTVQVDDVHIAVNKQKIMFMLRSSKTHSRSMLPQKIKISSSRHKPEPTGLVPYLNYCPYSLIRRYLEIRPKRKNQHEQFFIFQDSTGVNPNNFRKCLKNILRVSGFDYHLYSSHSFRIGHGCDLIKYGVLVETIKHLGRWQSNAVFAYLKN